MTAIFLAGAAFAASQLPGSPAPTDDLLGQWKHGDMEIVIAPCGSSLCGTVINASARQQQNAENGSGSQLIGTKVIDNIEPTGPQSWSARVFLPDQNIYARGSIEETTHDLLTVRGCVAIVCKTSHWERISANEESSSPAGQ